MPIIPHANSSGVLIAAHRGVSVPLYICANNCRLSRLPTWHFRMVGEHLFFPFFSNRAERVGNLNLRCRSGSSAHPEVSSEVGTTRAEHSGMDSSFDAPV